MCYEEIGRTINPQARFAMRGRLGGSRGTGRMSPFDRLMQATRPYLTDGGLETSLLFQEGFAAPDLQPLH